MHSLHASKIEVARVNEEAPSFQLGCESRPYKWLQKSVLVQPAQGHLLYEESRCPPQPGVMGSWVISAEQ